MRIQTTIILWKLRARQRRSDRIFNKLVRQSGKPASECSDESWYADAGCESMEIEYQEKKAISDELYYQAQRLYLPTPEYDDNDKLASDYSVLQRRYLTAEAMTELRTAIRKERAERRAVVESWLKVVGGSIGILTGLVGALIGLVAIWKK
jgi:hypothetical protein